MPATSTAGVYMLGPEHADAIGRLAADPIAAALLGVAASPSTNIGRHAVEQSTAERLTGTTRRSAIVDRQDVKGFCALAGTANAEPDVRIWIAPQWRRAGYGSLGVRLTRAGWLAHRDQPAIAAIHPDLRAILDAELAAGNEIAETGGGWPDPDSVFVRLRDPFRAKPSALPPGVVYAEPNDPHWWNAEYSSRSPRHILAC